MGTRLDWHCFACPELLSVTTVGLEQARRTGTGDLFAKALCSTPNCLNELGCELKSIAASQAPDEMVLKRNGILG